MSSFNWPPTGSGSGITTYPTFADFPPTAADGTVALALDTDTLYAFNAGSMMWVVIGGPGAVLSLGPFGTSPNADGASITSNVLTLQPADGTHPGGVSILSQTFAGQKTFSTGLTGTLTGSASLNVLTSALGNLTDAGTDGIVVTGGTGAVVGTVSLAQHVADASHNGYLSSSDWTTFNSKQSAGNYITALTGDVTATGPGSVAATLATVNSNIGTFASVTVNGKGLVTAAAALSGDMTTSGSVSTLATVNSNVGSFSPAAITVNGKGLVTAASSVATGNLTDAGTDGITVTGGTGAVLGSGTSIAQHVADTTHNGYLSSTDWNTFNGKQAAGNYITALTGDVTASGPGSVAATLATVNSNVGSFGSNTGIPSFTVNGKGLITAASNNAVVTAPTASTIAAWDANKNLSANSLIEGFRTQATANSTLTLVVGDAFQQYFTGSTAGQIVKLSTTSIVAGQSYLIVNLSTQTVTVQSSGANTIQAMAANTQLLVTALVSTPTTAANWNATYQTSAYSAPVNPTVQTFTSGSAQTYTTPTGVQYIRVRMVGGGGGGGGSGTTASGTTPTAGAASTFFNASAGGGGAGTNSGGSSYGGAGGTSSLGAGAIGTALPGGYGDPSTASGGVVSVDTTGGSGGASFFGGSGGGGLGGAGQAGATNTGGGGGGAGTGAGIAVLGGSGGGAGGYVEAIITSPAATYTYTVGSGGSAGGAGSGGFAGAAGAAGYIEVTEYYSNLSISGTTSVSANLGFFGPSSGSAANPTFRSLVAADLSSQGLETVFTASGTFTTPSTSTTSTIYQYTIVGAGGGSGGTNGSNAVSAGGGAGAVAMGTFTGVSASTGITITVGAAGTAGTNTGGNGGSGGSSSIGSPVSITCTGGSGSSGSTSSANQVVSGGAGGTVSVGSPPIALAGNAGGNAFSIGGTLFMSGAGGNSVLGQGGQSGVTAVAGTANSTASKGYGAGGAGVFATTATGNAGTGGIVIITQLTP